MVTQVELERKSEQQLVRAWRLEQLLEAGYRDLDAALIAADPSIELELARRIVLELGCPPPLAARILT